VQIRAKVFLDDIKFEIEILKILIGVVNRIVFFQEPVKEEEYLP
jgi:hypothetical protein